MSEYCVMPGCFPGLLGEKAAEIAKRIRHSVELYDGISEHTGSWWEKIKQRSPMEMKKVEQVVMLLKKSEYRVTDQLASVVKADWSGVTQTKVIEDGVRTLRMQEQHKGFHKRLSDESTWLALMREEAKMSKWRYECMDFHGQVVPRGISALHPRALFNAASKKVPPAYRQVVSARAKTQWYSPSALTSLGRAEDAPLLEYCRATKQLPHCEQVMALNTGDTPTEW